MESAAHVVFLSPSVRWMSLFHYRGRGGVLCDQPLFYPSISRLTMAESHLSGGLLPLSLSLAANKHRLYAEFPYLTTFKSLLILSLHDICTSEFKMRHTVEASPPKRSTQVAWGLPAICLQEKGASKFLPKTLPPGPYSELLPCPLSPPMLLLLTGTGKQTKTLP